VVVVEEGSSVPAAHEVGVAVVARDVAAAVARVGVARVLLPVAKVPRRLPAGEFVARTTVNWCGRGGGSAGRHWRRWGRSFHSKKVEVEDLPGCTVEVGQDILELVPHGVQRRGLDVPGVEQHFGQQVHLCNAACRPVN